MFQDGIQTNAGERVYFNIKLITFEEKEKKERRKRERGMMIGERAVEGTLQFGISSKSTLDVILYQISSPPYVYFPLLV